MCVTLKWNALKKRRREKKRKDEKNATLNELNSSKFIGYKRDFKQIRLGEVT